MSGTILLTGFDAFGGDSINPSIDLATSLKGEIICGLRIEVARLPCQFGCAPEVLYEALGRWSPQLVLAIGQAAGRPDLSFERVAINLIDARIPDNALAQPIDQAIDADGPAACFSTLPIKRMVAAVRRCGIPASVSYSAGTFVCNQVFYALQRKLSRYSQPVPSGFMHVPLLPEQAARRAATGQAVLPSMSLAQMVHGTRAALEAALSDPTASDILSSEGTLE